jgi:hypothetical protein
MVVKKIKVVGNEEKHYKEWHELSIEEKYSYLDLAFRMCEIKAPEIAVHKTIAIFDKFLELAPPAFSLVDAAKINTTDYDGSMKKQENLDEKLGNFTY